MANPYLHASRTRRRWPWVVGGVGVAVLLVVALVWALVTGVAAQKEASLAEAKAGVLDAMAEYEASIESLDCERFLAIANPGAQTYFVPTDFTCDNWEQALEVFTDADTEYVIRIDDVEQYDSDNTATVITTETLRHDNGTVTASRYYEVKRPFDSGWIVYEVGDQLIPE